MNFLHLLIAELHSSFTLKYKEIYVKSFSSLVYEYYMIDISHDDIYKTNILYL